MDFMIGLLSTRKLHDSIWVIFDKMTKSTDFIPVKSTYRVEDYAKMFIDEIVRWHGIPLSIRIGEPSSLLTFGDISKRAWTSKVYHSSIGMTPFEALYGRRCRSPVGWSEVGESSILGPDIIHEATEKVRMIRDRLTVAFNSQNSYADNRKMALKFEVGDQVYMKISPMKGVMRFGKKGKLSLRYVGPYEVLQRCLGDPTSILPVEGLGVGENLSYKEVPVEILDRQVKHLRNKEVATVKVLWRNHLVERATWEAEADMRSRYSHLFNS
ncbi:uncharacterized protein [Solanum lycopersicum]|uniref:uncharacterized protein n=1 Tax=Solanum lycopersicum TaxID=4081 RepID=UPI003748EFE3